MDSIATGIRRQPDTFLEHCIDLDNIYLSEGSVLIQYVDDLLVCSDTVEQCKEDTVTLLTALAEKGHKVNKSKLQLWKDKVDYLRHTLMAGE